MAKWSFLRKLSVGLIMIGMLAVLSSAASLVATKVLMSNVERTSASRARDLADVTTLQVIGERKVTDASNALLTGEAAYAREVRAESAVLEERIRRLKSRPPAFARASVLDELLRAEQRHQAAFDQAWSARGRHAGRLPPHVADPVLASGVQFERALDELAANADVAASGAGESRRSSVPRALGILNAVTFASLALSVIMIALLTTLHRRRYRAQVDARMTAEQAQSHSRAALTEAEATNRVKDEFLSTVSHELRNPLAPILTWTQLLRSGTLDAERSARALEVIERNVKTQAQLIDDLIDVSRVVTGKFRLEVRPIELPALIKAAADSQRGVIEAKQIRVELDLDERAGPVSGDSERLQQVLWNLISNAIKFTPKGGHVQVSLARVDSHAEITVSDSGIGIDPAFLPHVFDPFRQETGGSMRRHGGLGLGLSIVHHIVELHGGEIIASSSGTGSGTTFRVRLPLLETHSANGESTRHRPIEGEPRNNGTLGRLDRIRVLIVDDEPSANEALLALFESCGAKVRTAGTVAEAYQAFDSWRPDVLVSDIAMPGEDGYALIHRIRALPIERGGGVPAVALTAYAKIDDRVSILAAGFQMYLSKPTDPSELVAVVSSLAARRGPQSTLENSQLS